MREDDLFMIPMLRCCYVEVSNSTTQYHVNPNASLPGSTSSKTLFGHAKMFSPQSNLTSGEDPKASIKLSPKNR